MNHDTPFDVLVLDTWKRIHENPNIDQKLNHIYTCGQLCKINYLKMQASSDIFWQRMAESKRPPKQSNVSDEQMVNMNTESIEAKINYFSFLETINRYGRLFKNTYRHILPDYYRISFFRNKMIEHWNEYILSDRTQLIGAHGKQIVPYHFGVINFTAEAPVAYGELRDEFKKQGINLPSLDLTDLYIAYSEKVFSTLEILDNTLNSRKKIPDSLVNALFRLSFPTPIHSIEDYSKIFIVSLQSLL